MQGNIKKSSLKDFVDGPVGSQMQAEVKGQLNENSEVINSAYLKCFKTMRTLTTYTKTGQEGSVIQFDVAQEGTVIEGLPPGLNKIAAEGSKRIIKCVAKLSSEDGGEDVIADCKQSVFGQKISYAMKLSGQKNSGIIIIKSKEIFSLLFILFWFLHYVFVAHAV